MKTLAHDHCRTELLDRLRRLRPDTAPTWGRMTAHQMVCHLADACRMATGDRAVAPVRAPLPPAMMKWIALYLPLRWPAGIPTVPELDPMHGGTPPGDFASDRAEVEALLGVIAAREKGFVSPRHPIFGAMSRADWLRWGYLHTAHHLEQFGL